MSTRRAYRFFCNIRETMGYDEIKISTRALDLLSIAVGRYRNGLPREMIEFIAESLQTAYDQDKKIVSLDLITSVALQRWYPDRVNEENV